MIMSVLTTVKRAPYDNVEGGAAVADIATDVLEQEQKDRRALKVLLDRHLSRNDRVLVERGEMGGTESFIGSVTLEWFAQRVGFAAQLPLFKERIDPKSLRVQIDSETINDIQQRPLDWSRQAVLAQYLAARTVHKFPPVLVVITRNWVDDLRADEWDRDKRAVRSAADFVALDSQGRVGLLDVSEEVQLFALDGQHRLMGVQGLMELIKSGSLQPWSKEKSRPVGQPITADDLLAWYGVSASHLQSLRKERIGIEFIAAVVPGESREEARRRVKSIFVHVNRMAARLTEGQLAQLDEDDGFAVVARVAAVKHPLLKPEAGRAERVEWNHSTISTNSTTLTTLQSLKEMSTGFLAPGFRSWLPRAKNLVPMRPEEEELHRGQHEFNDLLTQLANLPSYQRLEKGEPTGALRRFKDEGDGGEGHMLFRPVGQIALAAALGELHFLQQKLLGPLFEKLRAYDSAEGFRMESPGSLWYMVLYDPNKKRMQVRGERLATRLLIYLLGGLTDELEQQKLTADLAAARTIEEKAMGLDGLFVDPKEIKLPPVL
jgi:DGQHR domain-containing protein